MSWPPLDPHTPPPGREMRAIAWRPGWGVALLLSGTALLFVSSGVSSHRPNAKKISQTTVMQAAAGRAGTWCPEELLSFRALSELFVWERADTWVCSLLGSIIVGLSGIFPLLVIPIEAGAALKTEAGCRRLKQLLSFAIGGLLGDVFLHLLPEAWAYSCRPGGNHQHHQTQGLWVILGMLSFLILEKMFPDEGSQDDARAQHSSICACAVMKPHSLPGCAQTSSPQEMQLTHRNGHLCEKPQSPSHPETRKIKTSGYLNLLANIIDNFTHGLAVTGSFLVSRKVGFLTTFAILLHEIPHEVGDFAILLRAGFDRWSAAKMQLSTALGGVLGACFALCAQSPKGAENSTAWILPFSSGGFLYIALVSVVPDLLEETNPRQSLLQILLLCSGIAVMALMSAIVE
ncbi:zinc transporter ZIP13 isoform X1 [Conger conger]|uniref:zinc transporter ZIP13 isoform X1 n=1 Tax=Conger conger TaxID=82655 RepID=UPI002A5A0CBF|nr:zinc transporter ZIP13 isoform X1 [Conger conger]